MRAGINFIVLIFALFATSAISSEITSSSFKKRWGGGTLDVSNVNGVIRLVTDGMGNPDFVVAPINIDDLKGKNIFLEIKVNEMELLSGVELRLGDENFENYYALSIPYYSDPEFNIIQDQHWHSYSFGLANARVKGQPKDKVESIGIYVQDTGRGSARIAIKNIRYRAAAERGYVSLTFDDGYDDHYYAATLMEKYGFPGTAYIMPQQVGEPGYMTLAQIEELKSRYGWGISSHHAIPYTEFNPDALSKEIEFTLEFLSQNGFSSSAPHLAYPLGKQDRDVVLPSVRMYFRTARVAGGGVETIPPADPHLLRTVNVLDSTTPETLVKIVRNAVANGQWAILMFHYLVDRPKTPIEYSKTEFERFLELLDEEDVPVMPVHKVYRRLMARKYVKN